MTEKPAQYLLLPIAQLTPEQQKQVLSMLTERKSWKVCAQSLGYHDEMPLLRFRDNNPAFAVEASRAIEQACHAMADELLTIHQTEENPLKARLASENMKWWLGKRQHKIYGDRLDVNIEQNVSINSALDAARSRIMRPSSDLAESANVQDADYVEIFASPPSDQQSDAPAQVPGTKDANDLSLDDLLS